MGVNSQNASLLVAFFASMLTGSGQQQTHAPLRHGNPQRFRRFEVDHQFRPTEFVPGVMSRIVVNR
jgi:hypothetical protein